jgi:transcriptional regulator with XRE-family HTH domain
MPNVVEASAPGIAEPVEAEAVTALPLMQLGDKRVGKRIRLRRRRLGLTQAQLGTKAALSQPTVSRIERDPRVATVGQICALCEALGVTPFQLSGESVVELTLDEARLLRVKDLAEDSESSLELVPG